MSYGAPFLICEKKFPDEPYDSLIELPVSFPNSAPTSLNAKVRSEAAATVISPARASSAGGIDRKISAATIERIATRVRLFAFILVHIDGGCLERYAIIRAE